MNIARMVTTIRHRLALIQMDGFAQAGNWPALREAAAREALLRAELASTGTDAGTEPADDDDEDGADDDCKVAAC